MIRGIKWLEIIAQREADKVFFSCSLYRYQPLLCAATFIEPPWMEMKTRRSGGKSSGSGTHARFRKCALPSIAPLARNRAAILGISPSRFNVACEINRHRFLCTFSILGKCFSTNFLSRRCEFNLVLHPRESNDELNWYSLKFKF